LKSSNRINDPSEFVLIGKVVAAHGIKGAVKVVSYADSSNIFQTNKTFFTLTDNGVFNQLNVLWCKPHCHKVQMGFSKVVNRNQAEAMVGLELYLKKSQLARLEEDTYYWFELIGLRVVTVNDEFIGHIIQILPTGGNDVYVIKRPNKANKKECLIPAVADVIQRVDLVKKTMVINLPEGLMDL
jgi:16S rRNA processing protein RimM